MAKPGPKKSQATLDREKKTALNWTQKEQKARQMYVETSYLPSFRMIAGGVKTSVEIVKQWATNGNWELLRLHRQMQLTEKSLREKGFDLESVHIGCLALYVETINASSRCVSREKNKYVPNFVAMREAIATAAMAEEQVRQIYQWMPTVEQKLIMRDMIDESKVRVRDMIKEYLGNNEPVFTALTSDDESTD